VGDVGDPPTVGRLTAAGLIEVAYNESYRYLEDFQAQGYVRVTGAGRDALESGRYRAATAARSRAK
jgi:hypothetical protein